jgi:hypothetical protein
VRDACRRHLEDLKHGHERGLVFDVEAALRAIGFFADVLRLNGGEYEGKPYELLDWRPSSSAACSAGWARTATAASGSPTSRPRRAPESRRSRPASASTA